MVDMDYQNVPATRILDLVLDWNDVVSLHQRTLR